jgi:hypothetical protein
LLKGEEAEAETIPTGERTIESNEAINEAVNIPAKEVEEEIFDKVVRLGGNRKLGEAKTIKDFEFRTRRPEIIEISAA